jgi:protein-tyrosine-phosphatase
MAFKKATKAKSKLRAALFGPSGAGKTYTALSIASGMGKKIALIDSERGSASKYADRFDFDVVDLANKSVGEYCNYIDEAAAAGYEVLVIDSLSHAWQTLNEEVEKIADARYKGNYWAAWSEGTPMQRKLVNSLVSYPGHIIATMRSKTEWQTGGGEGNKSRPIRVGLAPEQGKGIEYEFDVLFEITPEHLATIIKDRTGKFQDRIIEKPDKSFGEELVAWLNEGVVTIDMQIQEVMKETGNILKSKNEKSVPYFTDKEYDSVRLMCRDSISQPKEQRLVYLQNLLNEWKNCLHFRVSQNSAPPKPAAPAVPDKPMVTQTTTAQTQPVTAKPAAGNKGRSQTDMPSMYSEQEESFEPDANEFEDDIPDGRGEPVAAGASFEDIFLRRR